MIPKYLQRWQWYILSIEHCYFPHSVSFHGFHSYQQETERVLHDLFHHQFWVFTRALASLGSWLLPLFPSHIIGFVDWFSQLFAAWQTHIHGYVMIHELINKNCCQLSRECRLLWPADCNCSPQQNGFFNDNGRKRASSLQICGKSIQSKNYVWISKDFVAK